MPELLAPKPNDVPPNTSSGRQRSWRKTMYAWHCWAGFQLAVLTFTVLLTGTLAVIGNEIDWVLDNDRHVSAFDGEPAWRKMHEQALAIADGADIRSLQLGEISVMAAEAHIVRGRNIQRVFLDPQDGRVLGTGGWINVQRILRDFHRYLFILVKGLGLPIVTISAVVLAIQLVSGLATTRKWGRGLVTLPRLKNSRVFLGDLHRFLGLWTTWFSLLIVVTSFWYFAEWVIHRSGGRVAAPILATSAPADDAALPYSLDVYVSAAKEAFPELRITQIVFPNATRGQFLFTGPSIDWMLRDRASRVTVDASTAAVLAIQRPSDLTAMQYAADLADPWHFGDVGGLWTKLLWFVAGSALTFLSASGVWLTWRRTQQGFGRWHAASSIIILIGAGFGAAYLNYLLS